MTYYVIHFYSVSTVNHIISGDTMGGPGGAKCISMAVSFSCISVDL